MSHRSDYNRRNDSAGLMMMELTVAILIFALISSACVLLFAKSRDMIRESATLSWASEESMDLAEILRASDSQKQFTERLRKIYPKLKVGDDGLQLYFRKDFRPCGPSQAACVLKLKMSQSQGMLQVDMETSRTDTGQVVYSTRAKHYSEVV